MEDEELQMGMFRLVRTCHACPEQYDVFLGGEQVGYMRLRHGYFSVEDAHGTEVYSARPNGDGIFDYDERAGYLRNGLAAIALGASA